MFWYIDRDSNTILITSEKWRKKASVELVTGWIKRSKKRKEDKEEEVNIQKPFCFSSFLWFLSFLEYLIVSVGLHDQKTCYLIWEWV